MKPMTPGLEGVIEREVTADIATTHLEDAGIAVLATPRLVALCEEAAIRCIEPYLEEGEGSVGTEVFIQHKAATPIGMTVTVRARLTEVDGRRLTFTVTAEDEQEEVAECRHQRFVIDNARFLKRLRDKVARHRGG